MTQQEHFVTIKSCTMGQSAAVAADLPPAAADGA